MCFGRTNSRQSGGGILPAQSMGKGAMRHATIIVLLLAALAGTAVAGPFEDAVSAYDRGDYATARREFRVLAEKGLAEAQFNLGLIYEYGQGVQQDYAEAVKWFRRAAEQGDANAQYNLGAMYGNGNCVPQDYAEAVKWYRSAAEQGDSDAQFILGVMYNKGHGVPPDYSEAVKWFRHAAEQGDANAQFILGVMYGESRGVPRDNVQAYKWFDLVASQYSALERERAVLYRDFVAAKMTQAQIAEAQKLAREWKPK